MYLSCLVLIFCSSCLFLCFSSERRFFSTSSSLSRRSKAADSVCRTLIRSSISLNLCSHVWWWHREFTMKFFTKLQSNSSQCLRCQSYALLEIKKTGWSVPPVSHPQLLLQLSSLFSVDSDNEVLGRVQSRATGANLVGVKGPLHCVPLLWCV